MPTPQVMRHTPLRSTAGETGKQLKCLKQAGYPIFRHKQSTRNPVYANPYLRRRIRQL